MQITLETLKQLRAQPEGNPATFASGSFGRPSETEVRHDTFFGMTIGDAARKYLTMTKITKSTADIATALEQGGLKHSSQNFTTTVRSVLGQRDEFTRVGNRDWGLAEWYPGAGRGRKAESDKPKGRKRVTKERRARSEATVHEAPESQERPIDRVEAYLADHPNAQNHAIAEALGMRLQAVAVVRSKLQHRAASGAL